MSPSAYSQNRWLLGNLDLIIPSDTLFRSSDILTRERTTIVMRPAPFHSLLTIDKSKAKGSPSMGGHRAEGLLWRELERFTH